MFVWPVSCNCNVPLVRLKPLVNVIQSTRFVLACASKFVKADGASNPPPASVE